MKPITLAEIEALKNKCEEIQGLLKISKKGHYKGVN